MFQIPDMTMDLSEQRKGYNPYSRQVADVLGVAEDGRILLKVQDTSLLQKCSSVDSNGECVGR